jgi:TIR domain
MNVFISWSGERSRLVGNLLGEWLQCVIQALEPWMSDKDIDRGSLWFSEIANQLKDTTIGIICLTQENKNKPWILFEAGALAKGLSSNRVCTLLIDLEPSDIQDPLAQFNHTVPDKDGMWRLVRTLNNALGENRMKDNIIERVFETYWPQFKEEFDKILNDTPQSNHIEKRSNDEILSELLYVTRRLDKRIRELEIQNSPSIKTSEETGYRELTRIPPKIAKDIIKKMVDENESKEFIFQYLRKYHVPASFIEETYRNYIEKLEDKNKEVTTI